MMLWLFLLFTQIVHASAMVIVYSTDLSDQPTVHVEHSGQTHIVQPKRLPDQGRFATWELSWDSEATFVHHLTITHPSSPEAVDTVLFGRANDQQIYLLHQSSDSRQQILSAAGGVEENRANELAYFQRRLIWMWLVAIAIVALRWSSPQRKWNIPDQVQKPWVAGGVFLLCSAWLQRSILLSFGLPGKYHDALGTFWLMARAKYWDGLFDPHTVYPQGADYGALDSYLLWLLTSLFSFLSPLALYKILLVVFPALSAWAAERLAVEWNIDRPWSWLVGLAFGFSGLMGNAILEGQVYHCFTAGLPLTALFAKRYIEGPSLKRGALLLFSFSLCLFSSSYLGASGLILLLGYWIGSGAWKRPSSWLVVIGVLPILAGHYGLMSTEGIHEARNFREMFIGSVTLSNFWGATPEMDREGHAIGLGMSIVALVLATQFRRRMTPHSTTPVLLVGLLSLVLAIGPALSLSHLERLATLPTAWLYQQTGFSSIGFPIRLAHPFILAIALLAGLTAQSIAAKHRFGWVLFALILIDVGQLDLDRRQSRWLTNAPDISELEGTSIFTLYPTVYSRIKGTDANLILYMENCLSQVTHQKAISNNCLTVNIDESAPKQLQQDIIARAFTDQPLFAPLTEQGIDLLMVYPELFRESDRIRLQRRLKQEGELLIEGTTPLYYQVYRARQTPRPPPSDFTASEVTLDVITSRDRFEPVLLFGNERFAKTTVEVDMQTVRHRAVLPNMGSAEPLLVQSTDGTVLWEGVLRPNPERDHFTVRADLGLQMEIPLLNSPPVLSENKPLVYLLFGSLLLLVGLGRMWFNPTTSGTNPPSGGQQRSSAKTTASDEHQQFPNASTADDSF